jgi:hypothetical protein
MPRISLRLAHAILSAAIIEASFILIACIVRLLLRHAAVEPQILDHIDLAAICGGLAVIWTVHCVNISNRSN